MAEDFLGSIAQEDVQFFTEITRETITGENYYKAMVFVENTRFIVDPTPFIPVPNLPTVRIAAVTADMYAKYTSGLLKSWLYDFFCTGHTRIAYIVAFVDDTNSATDIADITLALTEAYDILKAHAYHKTICVTTDELPDQVTPAVAMELARLCTPDYSLLSSRIYVPYATATPLDLTSDPLIEALDNEGLDYYATAHQDITRNGALFSLGLALSLDNNSGTPVGNNIDYWASDLITLSGFDGTNLDKATRDYLKTQNITFFKPVGDASGKVANVGVVSRKGDYMQARWIVNYINYMSKVKAARAITKPNFLRNATNFATLVTLMSDTISLFGPNGSGRLSELVISPPPFNQLPKSKGDEIIIPKAWSALYTDQVHSVRVYGDLTIPA